MHAAVATPPLRTQRPYGVKMPPDSHMIFNHLDHDTAVKALELDGLTYSTPEEFQKAVGVKTCVECFLKDHSRIAGADQ